MSFPATAPKIAILTFCVGADYKKCMEPGLASKRAYAEKHGYEFITGGEDVWDRTRPIPWSKFNFIRKYIDAYDYIFWSDADAIILNQSLRLEDHILPRLPADKDMLWSMDACNHLNNGHVLYRGRSAWVKDFLDRAYAQTELIYHIWWDNAAMIKLYETNPADKAKIETCMEHWAFNSYVFGPNDSAVCSETRLYKHGDFLIHFAGVYNHLNIYRMMKYFKALYDQNLEHYPSLLDSWRRNPPITMEEAYETYLRHT
jgi:hypothetical protein